MRKCVGVLRGVDTCVCEGGPEGVGEGSAESYFLEECVECFLGEDEGGVGAGVGRVVCESCVEGGARDYGAVACWGC